jgi:hypothetical protein
MTLYPVHSPMDRPGPRCMEQAVHWRIQGICESPGTHGLGSNPDWAWRHEQTGAMWLRDFLPKSFPQARIMAFNHNSAWSMNAPVRSVEVCGEQLLHVLNTRRETAEVSLHMTVTPLLILMRLNIYRKWNGR